MRATLSGIMRETSADIASAADRLTMYQRQVSSGRRIDVPSDDPGAAASSVQEHSQLASVSTYTKAADSSSSRLTLVDSVLTDIVSRLTAAQTAAVGAEGTTVTPAQRSVAAQELSGLRDSIFQDMNTSFSGVYLFSGSATTTPPYGRTSGGAVTAYQGDTNAVSVDVDRGRTVQVTLDGSALAQGSDTVDLFTTFSDLITAVQTGDSVGISAGVSALQRAFDRATTVQSHVGSDLEALDVGSSRLNGQKLASATRIAGLENANMADAISGMNQSDAAYRAALAAASKVMNVSLMDYLK